MATERQVDLIEQLLEELDLGRRDLAGEDEAWAVYERLGVDEAGELVDFLIEQKREALAW